MNKKEVINKLKKYVKAQELACPHTFNKWGEQSWNFMSLQILATLLWVRELINKPIVINNYNIGGSYSQRGLRCNLCQLVKDKTNRNQHYMSQHQLANGVDFSVADMTAEQVRNILRASKDKAPYPFRLERNVSWVHIDCMDLANGQKLNEFNP